jgi:hypothetical protein
MRTIDKVIALGLALGAIALGIAALGAGTATAFDASEFKADKFKVEVKGTQDSVMHNTREAAGPCDVSDFSTGREHLIFHTTKPIVITAIESPGGGFNPEFFSGSRLAIPTVATIDRSYTPQISGPADPSCEENGGGAEATKPDCGRRHVKFPVHLQYGIQNHDGLILGADVSEEKAYEACPQTAPTESFPWLLTENSGSGKFIYANLSQKELFDPSYQQWISLAEGSRKVTSDDSWTQTTIHWDVSFTRLKK